MTTSGAAIGHHFRAGRFLDVVAEEGATLEQRLIQAEACARMGRLDAAAALAVGVFAETSDPVAHARCESVLALLALNGGYVIEALQRLQRATKTLLEARRWSDAAACDIFAFRILAERQQPELLNHRLAELRRLVLRAGDPQVAALFHEAVARHEAQRGSVREALQHLQIAGSLLRVEPNAWIEQLCSVAHFCISCSQCDFASARAHLRRALELVAVTGALESMLRAHEGHLLLQLGKFTKAESLLRRVANHGRGEAAQRALDGLARVYLATGRLDKCEEILHRLRQLRDESGSTPSYPFRASLITEVHLAVRRAQWRLALETAQCAVDEGSRMHDRSLLTAGRLLLAQALYSVGSLQDSARVICEAVSRGTSDLLEQQGLFAHVCSKLCQVGHPRLWFQRASRAQRIWHHQGNMGAAAEHSESAEDSPAVGEAGNSRGGSAPSLLTDLFASAFDLAYAPRLLAAELEQAIRLLDCSPEVRLVESHSEFLKCRDPQWIALPLDDSAPHARHRLALVSRIPADPSQAIMLGQVLRLGRAALELEAAQARNRNRAALWPAEPVEELGGALFLAEEMQSLLATARRIAPTAVPVLITGETGTGKEVLARTIHAYSQRANGPFLPFNCTATPRDMLESQLFGHRRGAFTGATEHFQGVVRAAAGGTLFLDEIGELGLDVQPKLLRFLESAEIHPIGETRPLRADVRIIAATNADLNALVAEGRFREDLFYRLNIVRLHVPPLRERKVEIPALANHFLEKHARECGKTDLRLAEETIEYLVLYRWPGNVRQLANEMRRLAALAENGAVLMPEHLSPDIASSRRTIPASERTLQPTELVVRLDQPLAAAVRHVERAMVQYALEKCGGRLEETAALLGLSRKGLYLKRQRLGIDAPAPPEVEVA